MFVFLLTLKAGGRQNYTDRRERLLQELEKRKNVQYLQKETNNMSSKKADLPSKDIDSLIDYIEGKPNEKGKKKKTIRTKKVGFAIFFIEVIID